MDDRQIIQQAAEEVGQKIGRLQGRLFVVEAEREALQIQIQRLDAVFQNLQRSTNRSIQQKSLLNLAGVLEALGTKLPALDPESQLICSEVIDILTNSARATPDAYAASRKAAIARLESRAWKQGEAIALAQQIVQSLRD